MLDILDLIQNFEFFGLFQQPACAGYFEFRSSNLVDVSPMVHVGSCDPKANWLTCSSVSQPNSFKIPSFRQQLFFLQRGIIDHSIPQTVFKFLPSNNNSSFYSGGIIAHSIPKSKLLKLLQRNDSYSTSMDSLAWRDKATGIRTSNQTSHLLMVFVMLRQRVGTMFRRSLIRMLAFGNCATQHIAWL